MKFNDLVWSFLETGDPYLRETAEHCANAYYAAMRSTWPARSMGRGAMPATGHVQLAQFFRELYFLQCAVDVVKKGLFTFSQPELSPGHQMGVGPNGVGNVGGLEGRGFADLVLCQVALEIALHGDEMLDPKQRRDLLKRTDEVLQLALEGMSQGENRRSGWVNYQTDMLLVSWLPLAKALNRLDDLDELETWIVQAEDYLKSEVCGRPYQAVTGRAYYDSVTLGARWNQGVLTLHPWLPADLSTEPQTAVVWTPQGA